MHNTRLQRNQSVQFPTATPSTNTIKFVQLVQFVFQKKMIAKQAICIYSCLKKPLYLKTLKKSLFLIKFMQP
jgi:hypothetical protein